MNVDTWERRTRNTLINVRYSCMQNTQQLGFIKNEMNPNTGPFQKIKMTWDINDGGYYLIWVIFYDTFYQSFEWLDFSSQAR